MTPNESLKERGKQATQRPIRTGRHSCPPGKVPELSSSADPSWVSSLQAKSLETSEAPTSGYGRFKKGEEGDEADC